MMTNINFKIYKKYKNIPEYFIEKQIDLWYNIMRWGIVITRRCACKIKINCGVSLRIECAE